MKVIESEEFEELAIEWQYVLICMLKEELLGNGIKPEQAKDIVSNFIFSLSMLHDQGEIEFQGKSYSPQICFSVSGNENTLVKADEDTDLHDYAMGSTDVAFEE